MAVGADVIEDQVETEADVEGLGGGDEFCELAEAVGGFAAGDVAGIDVEEVAGGIGAAGGVEGGEGEEVDGVEAHILDFGELFGPVGERARDAGDEGVHAHLIDLGRIDEDPGVGDGIVAPGEAAVEGEKGPEGEEAGAVGDDLAGEGLFVAQDEGDADQIGVGSGVEGGDEDGLRIGGELIGGGDGEVEGCAGVGPGEFEAAGGVGAAEILGDGAGAGTGGELGDGTMGGGVLFRGDAGAACHGCVGQDGRMFMDFGGFCKARDFLATDGGGFTRLNCHWGMWMGVRIGDCGLGTGD